MPIASTLFVSFGFGPSLIFSRGSPLNFIYLQESFIIKTYIINTIIVDYILLLFIYRKTKRDIPLNERQVSACPADVVDNFFIIDES
jgi:hypothetical protein